MLPPKAAVKTSVEYAIRSKEGIAAALRDARAARLEPPPREEHARRLLFGFAIPITLFRIAWAEATTRRSIVRRLIPGLFCFGVATLVTVFVVSSRGPREKAEAVFGSDGGDLAASRDKDDEDIAELPPGVAVAVKHARDSAAPVVPPPKPPPSGRFAALHAAFDVLTSRIGAIVAALGVVEWILIWIGREHHDHIAYETSVLTGVIGEPLTGAARLRLDVGWLKLKAWRALRFVLFLLLVSPAAWVLGTIPFVGPFLSVALEAAWGAYWACVFAVANTFVAWHVEGAPRPPWFIRLLEPVSRVPVVGWLVRLYVRLVTFATRSVWPACMAFEECAWESAGLALARGVATLPFFYLVFRPMFPPAATHALLGRRAADATAVVEGAP